MDNPRKSFQAFEFLEQKNSVLNSTNFELIHDQSKKKQRRFDRRVLKIVLDNGLKALLVSDPGLTEASCALTVKCGTWDDPVGMEGMAHFVEHLVFLGSKPFPNESEYSQSILERGGQYNAYTKHDRTCYGFSIPNNFFSEALNRLSHLFIDPLFTESAVEREVNAVHHEFEDSIESDSLRVWRVLKETGNPDHPNAKLSCGNLDSLSNVTSYDIHEWFEKHYRPDKMRLVLQSSESLESMAEKVSEYFSKIPIRKMEDISEDNYGLLTSNSQRGALTCIRPSFKNRTLYMVWEVPESLMSVEKVRSVELLQLALDHGHPKSLVDHLEKEMLAKEVHLDFWRLSQRQGLLILSVVLTDEGIDEHEKVISKCFQGLHYLKYHGIPGYLVNRIKRSALQSFENSYDSNFEYVMRVSSELHDEEIETYPDLTINTADSLVEDFEDLLNALTPEQCVYSLVADPEELGLKLSRIEKWMKSEYIVRNLPKDKLDSWSQEPALMTLGFPPNFKEKKSAKKIVFDQEIKEETPISEPVFFVDDQRARMRWIQSPSDQATVDMFFCLSSALLTTSSKAMASNEVFVHRLRSLLNDEFLDHQQIVWNVEVVGPDLCVFISVPKENSTNDFVRFFKAIKKAHASKMQFNKIKKAKLDAYPGDPTPIDYAHQILDSFLKPFSYTKMELYSDLEQLEYEEYQEFQNSYFNRMFFEGAFLGGISKEDTIKLWKQVYEIIDADVYPDYSSHSKTFSFPEDGNSYLIRQKTHRQGNALLLVLEASDASLETGLIHKILAIILRSEFFETLRTKQQTAYKLHNWHEVIQQKICHCFSLQSSTHSPGDLLQRVETFLTDFSHTLKEVILPDRWEIVRNGLILSKLTQLQHVQKTEDLQLIYQKVEILSSLTYDKFIQAIETTFCADNRKRVGILVEGKASIPFESIESSIPYVPIEKERFYK